MNTINDYMGYSWKGSRFFKNPAAYPDRAHYMPVNAMLRIRYNLKPGTTDILKSTITGVDAAGNPVDPVVENYIGEEVKREIERAEYKFTDDSGILVSSDMNGAGTTFKDIVQILPNQIVTWQAQPGRDAYSEVKTLMQHSILWNDGLVSLWWCC